MKFSLSNLSPYWLLLVWFGVSESIDGVTALTPKQRSAPSSSVLLYFSRTNNDNDNDDFLNSPNDINYDSKPENGQKLDYYSSPAFDSFRKHSSKPTSTLSAPSAPSTLLAKPTPYQWTLLKPLSQNSRASESHHSSHRPKIVPYRHEFGLDVQNSPSHNKNYKKFQKLKKTKLDKKKRPSKSVDSVLTKTQFVKPVTSRDERMPPGNSGQSITYFTMHEKDEVPENGDDDDEEEEEEKNEEVPKKQEDKLIRRKVNNRNRPVEIKYRTNTNYQEQKPAPKQIYKPNLGYQQQKTRPVWNPAGRINTKQLINQFNLISMTPLLQPSNSINKNNENGKLAVLTSPFVVTKQNNQKYTLLNNQLIPLDTVTQALRQANMGQSIQRNPKKMEFGLISLLNDRAQRPEMESNDDYPQSSGWYRNTIDTIDHGYDRQQRTPHTYASLSPDFSPLAKVKQDKLRAATLETIGYLFS